MDVNKTEIAQYVVQMQNGDGQAFEKLYHATNQSGYFTALKILKDEDEAQDVLQDSYIAVLEKINDVRDPESFISWFHQIVANRAKKYLLKKKPSLFASNEEEQECTEFIPDEDEIWQPEQNVDEDDVRRQVMQIVDGLSDDKRTCVILYYYNEMSVADIAQTVGASENTVKARLFQARKDIRKEVEKLGKKNISLRGVAPISLLLWALRMASKADGAKFAAGPAAAAVMEGATAAVSSGAAASGAVAAGTATAAGAAQTAAATGGGLVAKIAALTVTQKVIAGVVTTAVVAGAATGTAAIVNHAKDETTTEPTTEAVAVFAEITAVDILDSITALTETEATVAESTEAKKTELSTEPTATTAHAETTTQAATTVSTDGRSSSVATAAASTTKERVTGFTVPSTKSTTKKETTSKATTEKETRTEKSSTSATTAVTTASTTAASYSPQPYVAPTTAPTTEPTTKESTEKAKGTATVNVGYSVADYGDSGSVSFTVQEGDAITKEMIESAVQEKLAGTYTGIEVYLRSGSLTDSAEATTYNYTVIVYAD